MSRVEGGILLVSKHDGGRTSIRIGEKSLRPDHHGSAEFTLQTIDEFGANFTYRSSFDHRTFGKNRISRDSGTFTVPWFGDAPSEGVD